jgi:branched-chain amino acid transport system ATP-binding protein
VLRVQNLKVNYGQIEAIKDVSFEVPAGKIVTLIGANGAGKTTTLRAVSGLEKASAGSVHFKGQPITNMEAHRLVPLGIAHVPEGRRIFPTLTVRENLELAGWSLRDKKEVARRMEEVFAFFPRIRERVGQLGGTLSGGEQQMLAVGRALMSKPTVLMMDEPSLGLSPIFVGMIFDIIREINATGVTVLLVEQNAKAALSVADTGYVMETGAISFSGSGPELLADDRVRRAYLGEG